MKLKGLLTRLTFPALFGAGILVGLRAVPCAGSVYLGVLALLSAEHTFVEGFGYLALYTGMFIAPLALLLGLASSPPVYRRLGRWQMQRRAYLKLGTSAAAITVGLFTLVIV